MPKKREDERYELVEIKYSELGYIDDKPDCRKGLPRTEAHSHHRGPRI